MFNSRDSSRVYRRHYRIRPKGVGSEQRDREGCTWRSPSERVEPRLDEAHCRVSPPLRGSSPAQPPLPSESDEPSHATADGPSPAELTTAPVERKKVGFIS